MSRFIFAGIESNWLGLSIESRPTVFGSARKRTKVPVAGRTGSLHIDEGAYEDSPKKYKCGFLSRENIAGRAHQIQSWLLSTDANSRLEDTYDPDIFRLATFVGPMDVENQLNSIGKCEIVFDCDPRCFLKSGENIHGFPGSGIIHNPTDFPAQPIITVRGTGAGTVTINGTVVQILDLTDPIVLDCELQDAYHVTSSGELENKNGVIKAPDFPVLAPGDNSVEASGDITYIEIKPRWWML